MKVNKLIQLLEMYDYKDLSVRVLDNMLLVESDYEYDDGWDILIDKNDNKED